MAQAAQRPTHQQRSGPALPPGAFAGVRVLEVTEELAQFTGKLLAELGAEVIKVEPPGGARVRAIGPFYHDRPDPNGSLAFWHYNVSKRSLTLNLNDEQGKRLFRQLAATADVVLEGGDPGYLEGLGLGYRALKALNPRLVYCAVTPFGQSGPWRDYKTTDMVHLALGGPAGVCGYDDLPDAPPIAATGGQSWHVAGLFAFISIASALIWRLQSGQGQSIDVSVHECNAVSTELAIPFYEYTGKVVLRQTGRHAMPNPSPPWIHRCRDGVYLCSLNVTMDARRFQEMVEWFAQDDCAEDLTEPMFIDDEYRAQNMGHVTEVIRRYCAKHDSDDVYRGAQTRSLPWAPARAPEENMADPHFMEDRGRFVQVEHPELGESFHYIGAPFVMHATPWRVQSRPPLVGEHTVEVLGELGVPPDHVVALREQGVV